MSYFANTTEYNIVTDNEVAQVLSHFSTEFILNLVRDNMNNKIRCYSPSIPNLIYAMEQNFKQISAIYTASGEEIEKCRQDTYKEIINAICNEYKLQFNENIDQDLYSSAFYLYSFLISDFNTNLISFFVNYIIKEKNSIYEMFNLNLLKRNKDSSTIYGKKLYKNTKLGIIHANLEIVVDNICQFDMPIDRLLNTIYENDRNIARYLQTIVLPVADLFKVAFVPYLYGELRPIILTNIKLALQRVTILDNDFIIGGNDNE